VSCDRVALRRQQEAKESDLLVNEFLEHGRFSADPDSKYTFIWSNLSKGLSQAPGINFSRYIIIN